MITCLGVNRVTDAERAFIDKCIATNDTHAFYTSKRWEALRQQVLRIDHDECQRCKNMYHRHRPATVVHHRQHLREHPELALSIWYTDATGKKHRNLESLCAPCHDEVHPEKGWNKAATPHLINEERWD